MPRLTHKNPSYRKHRASGQAIVSIDGQDIYLGTHGTKASRDEYDRIIGEWLANGRRLPAGLVTGTGAAADLSISEMLLRFWEHAQEYYRKPDGTPTGELMPLRAVIRVVRKLYGRQPASSFGPLALKAVRQKMIELGWCRTNINRQITRAKHIFKWAVGNELVPPSVYEGLRAVAGLSAGRTDAEESEPVRPVPAAIVEATLPFLSRHVQAMVKVQMLTGMRPAEVCAMTTGAVDRSENPWVYKPVDHKTRHHGHDRAIMLGPKAQELLTPFLKLNPGASLFSPAEAEAERLEELHKSRTTPLHHGNAPGTNRNRGGRKLGEHYDVTAYRRAIARACEDAFAMPEELKDPRTKDAIAADSPEKQKLRRQQRAAWHDEHVWHPHQLRHTAATLLRKEFGLEAAQVVLGHQTLSVTEIYAERNVEAAKRIMAQVG